MDNPKPTDGQTDRTKQARTRQTNGQLSGQQRTDKTGQPDERSTNEQPNYNKQQTTTSSTNKTLFALRQAQFGLLNSKQWTKQN